MAARFSNVGHSYSLANQMRAHHSTNHNPPRAQHSRSSADWATPFGQSDLFTTEAKLYVLNPAWRMTLHDFWLSQMKDWHREAIVATSDWLRLFHDANLLSGTAENHAVCLGLKL